MGDMAEMMLDGTLDEFGEYIGPGPGYPRRTGNTGSKYGTKNPKRGITLYLAKNYPNLIKKDYNEFCFQFVKEHLRIDELNANNRHWDFLAHKIQCNWQLFVSYCDTAK